MDNKEMAIVINTSLLNSINQEMYSAMGVSPDLLAQAEACSSATELNSERLLKLVASLSDERERELRKAFTIKYLEKKEGNHKVDPSNIYVFCNPRLKSEFPIEYSWIKFSADVDDLIIYEDNGFIAYNPYRREKGVGD